MNQPGAMFESLLTTHCDSYHPDFSLSLVNSLKSYIDLKLGHQQKSPKLINEVRRRLYLIHEYNCHVAKRTRKYPRTRKFDLLLIKYVELEFEVLYSNNPSPPKQLETVTELRILRLLQVMLYQAVLKNQSLIKGNTDAILKKAVLRLLSEVEPAYLAENKLVHNIATKLLNKIEGSSSDFDPQEIQRNLATSDYGTDDNDSDFENDVFQNEHRAVAPSADCVEVPLTVNGTAPVPIVEFVDDDDAYMVYLRSSDETKRKQKHASKNPTSEVAHSRSNRAQTGAQNDSCVIVCSDSEEEAETSPKSVQERKNNQKNNGVVTFEIIDDDDDDNGLNYMVYLQKEVESKKAQKCNAVSNPKEIIICSDSEDEVEASQEPNECASVGENDKGISSEEIPETLQKNDDCNKVFNEETLDDVFDFIETKSQNDKLEDTIPQENAAAASGTSEENLNLFLMGNEVGVNIGESAETSLLLDAAIIFDEITYSEIPTKLSSEVVETSNSTGFEEFGFDRPTSLGGPVLSEKVDDCDGFDNLQECRINDSLLEEFLLDDTYLLEGQKEFEELECFLFDDNRGEQKFYNSAFCTDNGSIFQAENLESFIDDSQVFKEANSVLEFDKTSDDSFNNGRKRKSMTKIDQHKLKKCNQDLKHKVAKEFSSVAIRNNCTSHELQLKKKPQRFSSCRKENRVNVR